MILYHVTPRANLESIMSRGLIAQSSWGLTDLATARRFPIKGNVFLTDKPEYILEEQGGPHWIRENHPIVLSVDVYGLPIEPFMRRDELQKHEWICPETIPPERLEVYALNVVEQKATTTWTLEKKR